MLQAISQARGDKYLVFICENLGFTENVLWGDVEEALCLCTCGLSSHPSCLFSEWLFLEYLSPLVQVFLNTIIYSSSEGQHSLH